MIFQEKQFNWIKKQLFDWGAQSEQYMDILLIKANYKLFSEYPFHVNICTYIHLYSFVFCLILTCIFTFTQLPELYAICVINNGPAHGSLVNPRSTCGNGGGEGGRGHLPVVFAVSTCATDPLKWLMKLKMSTFCPTLQRWSEVCAALSPFSNHTCHTQFVSASRSPCSAVTKPSVSPSVSAAVHQIFINQG